MHIDIEAGIRDIVLQHVNAIEQEAIARLIAAGYRVTKPKPKKAKPETPKLNAVGKPFSSSYDPDYRMKYKPSRAHLFAPMRHLPLDPSQLDWERRLRS